MSVEIKNIFYPKSICVAGASTKEKSIGFEILKSIKSYGFSGKIFPVNPGADSVLGYKCYKSISEIEAVIDLCIVVVPKKYVLDTIDELLEKEVKSIILITAGFRETGNEGAIIEKTIKEKITASGARMVGPNCMGVINTLPETRLNATFVAEKPETGSTGFLSQSGALGAAVLNSLRESNIKFAHFISAGNKADINENDILKFWQNDDNVKILTLYLESFEDGESLIKLIKNREITKPIIILKAGRTESGMKAASSHTGALSSGDKIIDAVFNQFGIVRADNLNELFNTAKGFENFPVPKGKNVAVITNAGGPAILAVDKIEKEGLRLADLTDETRQELIGIVHPEGSINNPIDLLPGGSAETFKNVCEILISDKNVDSIISIFVEPVMVDAFSVIESVNSVKSVKPIMQVCMPLPEFWDNYKENSIYKKPVFHNPEDPAEVLANMLFYSSSKIKLDKEYHNTLDGSILKDGIQFNAEPGFLPQTEADSICKKYSLPIVSGKLYDPKNISEINDSEFPVVLKGISEKVVHKTEMNAVKLNINDKTSILREAEIITRNFKSKNLDVENFLIQPFLRVKHELLIGGYRDASLGPIIIFGTGGKYVEVFDDTILKSAYINEFEIEDMINKTKIGKILTGIRGEESVNLFLLKKIIMSCSKMLLENKRIVEFDINPLVLTEDNELKAVDVRIKIN